MTKLLLLLLTAALGLTISAYAGGTVWHNGQYDYYSGSNGNYTVWHNGQYDYYSGRDAYGNSHSGTVWHNGQYDYYSGN
jgi:hypothetical protein